MDYQELNFAIAQLKIKLRETDYKAIKFAEGLISDEEYQPIKEQREEWRKQINDYEALLPEAKDEWENSFLYDEEGETDI